MLAFLSNLKDNIKLILTSIGLAIAAWFSFLYVRRGERIHDLELDVKDKELENKTTEVETEIKEKSNDIAQKDQELNDSLKRFNESKQRFLKLRGKPFKDE